MWQLVFTLCHRLISKNNKMPKGCLVVMANPTDHSHGKNYLVCILKPLPVKKFPKSYDMMHAGSH